MTDGWGDSEEWDQIENRLEAVLHGDVESLLDESLTALRSLQDENDAADADSTSSGRYPAADREPHESGWTAPEGNFDPSSELAQVLDNLHRMGDDPTLPAHTVSAFPQAPKQTSWTPVSGTTPVGYGKTPDISGAVLGIGDTAGLQPSAEGLERLQAGAPPAVEDDVDNDKLTSTDGELDLPPLPSFNVLDSTTHADADPVPEDASIEDEPSLPASGGAETTPTVRGAFDRAISSRPPSSKPGAFGRALGDDDSPATLPGTADPRTFGLPVDSNLRPQPVDSPPTTTSSPPAAATSSAPSATPSPDREPKIRLRKLDAASDKAQPATPDPRPKATAETPATQAGPETTDATASTARRWSIGRRRSMVDASDASMPLSQIVPAETMPPVTTSRPPSSPDDPSPASPLPAGTKPTLKPKVARPKNKTGGPAATDETAGKRVTPPGLGPARRSLKATSPDRARPAPTNALTPEAAKPKAAKPTPAKPTPAKPTPAKPKATKPTPATPKAAKPTPATPKAAQPTPAKPAPAKPAAVKPKAAKPTPAKPKPAKPTPAKPKATKPAPAKPAAVKNKPSLPTKTTPQKTQVPATAQPPTAAPTSAEPAARVAEPGKTTPTKPAIKQSEPDATPTPKPKPQAAQPATAGESIDLRADSTTDASAPTEPSANKTKADPPAAPTKQPAVDAPQEPSTLALFAAAGAAKSDPAAADALTFRGEGDVFNDREQAPAKEKVKTAPPADIFLKKNKAGTKPPAERTERVRGRAPGSIDLHSPTDLAESLETPRRGLGFLVGLILLLVGSGAIAYVLISNAGNSGSTAVDPADLVSIDPHTVTVKIDGCDASSDNAGVMGTMTNSADTVVYADVLVKFVGETGVLFHDRNLRRIEIPANGTARYSSEYVERLVPAELHGQTYQCIVEVPSVSKLDER